MTTTVTKTVKSAGGDYSSLAGWEAGQQGDIVSGDTIQIAECYAGLSDTTAVTIDGWTTDATHYIRIRCPSGEGHNGYVDLTKYNLSIVGSGVQSALVNNEEFARIEGLQITAVSTTADAFGVYCQNAGGTNDNRIANCLIGAIANGGGFANAVYANDFSLGNARVTCFDTIVHDVGSGGFPNSQVGGIGFSKRFGNVIAYNCVAIACGTGYDTGNGTYAVKAINCVGYCYALNNNLLDFGATLASGSDYNASTDATAPGAHSIISQSSGNIAFTSTTNTNSGYCELGVGSTLASAGVNDPGSGLYSTDIRGAAFASPWDIGANARAGGGGPTRNRGLMMMGMGN